MPSYCQPQHSPETLSHMFLECPVASALWQWVAQVWAAFSGRDPPPQTAQVLMADDQSQWRPGTALQLVWTQIRIAFLSVIRDGSIQRRQGMPVISHLSSCPPPTPGQSCYPQGLEEVPGQWPRGHVVKHLLLLNAQEETSLHLSPAVERDLGTL